MVQRALYLLKTYLLTVLWFIAAKVVFMLANRQAHPFTVGDVSDVVTHGLTLDLSTALYILIVPFLLTVASVFTMRNDVLRRILRAYYALVAVAFALAFVADTSLYPFWGFKLDALCLQYLATPTEAMASVSAGYLVVRGLLLVALAAAAYMSFTLPRWHIPVSTHRVVACLAALLMVPVFVIGIRGGLSESTTNIGQVYYSPNQFLNHAAINPVFSFVSSFEKTASDIVDYDFYTDGECKGLMQGLYFQTSDSTDTLLTTTRPNIVIILMESAGEQFAHVMPNLQRLKQEGISFDRCYGNTWRTDRGTVCTLSGYPSFPTSSVMKMPSKVRSLPGIAQSLVARGYQTYYLYGGDINFTNMRSYLVTTGFNRLQWMKDFTLEQQQSAEWGVRDDITFQTLLEQLQRHAPASHADKRSPCLFGFSTLSSHEPWDVPLKRYPDEVANAFYYLDYCIGQFISQLRQLPLWQNTLVVLLPDHSIDYNGITETSPVRNRIPMVWVGGAVKEPRRIDVLCNQTDLAATLLGQLHVPHRQFRWSRDVLSRDYRYPFAVHNFNHGFSLVDSTGYIVYDLNAHRLTADSCSDSQRLERIGKAILQATTHDLKAL